MVDRVVEHRPGDGQPRQVQAQLVALNEPPLQGRPPQRLAALLLLREVGLVRRRPTSRPKNFDV